MEPETPFDNLPSRFQIRINFSESLRNKRIFVVQEYNVISAGWYAGPKGFRKCRIIGRACVEGA